MVLETFRKSTGHHGGTCGTAEASLAVNDLSYRESKCAPAAQPRWQEAQA